MKKFLIIIGLLIFIDALSLAQASRDNNYTVRLNYNTNVYNSVKSTIGHNYTPGFSFELGGKQFLVKGKGWFLEEAPFFQFNDLPFAKSVPSEKRDIAVLPYDRLRELGVGLYFVGGYDFIINEKMSLDVFAGPDFRYLIKYYPDCGVNDCTDHKLHKANLRFKIGAGLNINNVNISLSMCPDLLDRGLKIKRYRSVQVALGIGYYFK